MKTFAKLLMLLSSMTSVAVMADIPGTGQYYQGGVIFWVDPSYPADNPHGLIADISDAQFFGQQMFYEWSTSNSLTFARETMPYTGKANTNKIVAAMKNEGATSSANVCAVSDNQGFTDWYLPAISELQLLANQRDNISQTSIQHGGNALTGNYYWSSTESNSDKSGVYEAWGLSFDDGYPGYPMSAFKSNAYSVRCIRSF